jgi:hypothetical protein
MISPQVPVEDAYAWSKSKVLALTNFTAALESSREAPGACFDGTREAKVDIPQGKCEGYACLLRDEIMRTRFLRNNTEDECRRTSEAISRAEEQIGILTRHISDTHCSVGGLEEHELSKHLLLGGGGALEELRSLGPSSSSSGPTRPGTGSRSRQWRGALPISLAMLVMRLELPEVPEAGLSGYINGVPVHLFPSPSLGISWSNINFGWSCISLILQSLLRSVGNPTSKVLLETSSMNMREPPYDIVVLRGCAILTRRGRPGSAQDGCFALALRGGAFQLNIGGFGFINSHQYSIYAANDHYLPAVAALSIIVVYLTLQLDQSNLLRGALNRVEAVVDRYGTEVAAASSSSGGGVGGLLPTRRRVDLLPHWRFLFAPSGGEEGDSSPIMSDIMYTLRELLFRSN